MVAKSRKPIKNLAQGVQIQAQGRVRDFQTVALCNSLGDGGGAAGGPGGLRRAGGGDGCRDQEACRGSCVCTGSRVSLSCVSSMSSRVSPYQVPYLSTEVCQELTAAKGSKRCSGGQKCIKKHRQRQQYTRNLEPYVPGSQNITQNRLEKVPETLRKVRHRSMEPEKHQNWQKISKKTTFQKLQNGPNTLVNN